MCPGLAEPVQVTDNGDGTHTVAYTPSLEGPYSAVVKYADEEVPRRYKHACTHTRHLPVLHPHNKMVFLSKHSLNGCCSCSPFKFRVLPTHDASKVRASGPGLTTGVPASLPVEFTIDAKDAGEGQLAVLITVS